VVEHYSVEPRFNCQEVDTIVFILLSVKQKIKAELIAEIHRELFKGF